LGNYRLTWHRSALPANLTSSRPRSWSLGNATFVVAERCGWRRVLGASNPRPSAKGAHRYRKQACLEALRLAKGAHHYRKRACLEALRLAKGAHHYRKRACLEALRLAKGAHRYRKRACLEALRLAKGAHRYRKRACLEALKLATTKLTQRGTGYPSWGHPTQHNSESPEEAQVERATVTLETERAKWSNPGCLWWWWWWWKAGVTDFLNVLQCNAANSAWNLRWLGIFINSDMRNPNVGIFIKLFYYLVVRGSTVCWDTALQDWKSRILFPLELLGLSGDLIFRPRYGPIVDLASKRNAYQKCLLGC
jgi:hypothetical protein